MKLVAMFFLLLVFSAVDYSTSQGASSPKASASAPKAQGGASPSGSASAPKSSPKGGAGASGSASAPKSSPKGGASGSASAPGASTPNGGASGSASAPGASSPNAGASAKLPDGYVISGKSKGFISAVKLNKQKKETWNGARKACYHEGNGAFLAYADTKEEEEMYLKMMNKNKINNLWVGIHDLFENNGDYSTVRGEVAKEAAHLTWYPGEPNNYKGTEPCGEYRIAHGKKGLNDRRCNMTAPYLCKIRIPQPNKQ